MVVDNDSLGWRAPELLAGAQGRQTRAMDLFSLGCVLFYCMTAGRHPYGLPEERDMNIKENKMDLFLLHNVPEAKHLVSRLLSPEPHLRYIILIFIEFVFVQSQASNFIEEIISFIDRPKAAEVLCHPLFWNSAKKLSFIREASDRLESENRATGSNLLTAIENIAPAARYKRWDKKMDYALRHDIGVGTRHYDLDSVQDLLRFMRNKLSHHRELPPAFQVCFLNYNFKRLIHSF